MKTGRWVILSLVVGFLAFVTVVPATAQSRWDYDLPVLLGLVEDGMLVTVAPPSFEGCSSGDVLVNLSGMPNLDLWSVVIVWDEEAPLWDMRWVTNPQTLNIFWQNDAWIRVFPVTEQDVSDFLAAPCEFYTTRPFIAEGFAKMNYASADDALYGPGVNSWGWNMSGELENWGACPACQSPRLFWLQKWIGFSQEDVTVSKSTASKGPTLTCRR